MKKAVSKTIMYLITFAVCFLLALPVISMFGTSLKPKTMAMSDLGMFPKFQDVYLGNFSKVLHVESFVKSIFNSIFVSVAAMIFCVLIAAFAGYAISRFKGKIFSGFIGLLLVLQMLPMMLTLIPMFMIYKGLGLNNTHAGLIVAYISFSLTFAIWLLKGFFDSVPMELEESGLIDGCSQFQAFVKIILPISKPGLATVAIFTFVRSWNEYMMARILIQTDELKTINLALQKFVQENLVDWSLLSAGAVIATVPTLLFLLFAQKYLVQGLMAGAVKG